MIEVEDLTVRFGGVTPLDAMTVVFPGGACGLIGPNGAGKTTFFNVLSGFVTPVSGKVRAFGDDLLRGLVTGYASEQVHHIAKFAVKRATPGSLNRHGGVIVQLH